MAIKSTAIKQNWLVCFRVDPNISMPQVAVDKGRFQPSATRFHWPEQARNNFGVPFFGQFLQLLVMALNGLFKIHRSTHCSREEFLPCVAQLFSS
jgi:hypothetical protein